MFPTSIIPDRATMRESASDAGDGTVPEPRGGSPLPATPAGDVDPLRARYGGLPLPRGFREEAAGMDWNLFRAVYSPEPMLAITELEQEDGRWGAEITHHSKTRPARSRFREAEATGPAAACTALLAAEGRPVEILSFHQIPVFEATVTIIRAHHGRRSEWALGFGATNESSIAHAMSCAATRLHG